MNNYDKIAESEKVLWDVIDRAIFKTDDPEIIRERVKKAGAAWLKGAGAKYKVQEPND